MSLEHFPPASKHLPQQPQPVVRPAPARESPAPAGCRAAPPPESPGARGRQARSRGCCGGWYLGHWARHVWMEKVADFT